ncbi:UDP-glucose 4-epimerase [Entamoeba marina]
MTFFGYRSCYCHTVVELISFNWKVVVVDNLSNSEFGVIHAIKNITSADDKQLLFYKIDVCDTIALDEVLNKHHIDVVFHFAGLKSQPESFSIPLNYYYTNITTTLSLLTSLQKHNINNIIISSSASVYGNPTTFPISEQSQINPLSPYAATKAFMERIITDYCTSNPNFHAVFLRYFNPIGAHPSGLIGENPKQPNNLLPIIGEVLCGKRDCLNVFGADYDTIDGSCVRDYIHVVDVARGHISAMQHMNSQQISIYNLGMGIGVSVLELVNVMEKVSNKKIKYSIKERRIGDVPTLYTDCSKALKELQWKSEFTIQQACEDYWKYLTKNNEN